MYMRKLVLATASLLAMTMASNAGTIMFQVSEDGGPVTTINSGQDAATLGPVTFGDFNIANLSGATNPFLALPFLLQGQQISVSSAAPGEHTLHLTVLGTGLTAPTGPFTVASGFDVTGISAGWSVAESTDINGTIVGSHTFNGPLSSGADTDFTNFNFTTPFFASIHFDVNNFIAGPGAVGVAGESNTGAAIAAVPGPIVGAGLPGLLAAFGFGGWQWKRRRRVA
jgi:hypothetical protein